MTDPIPTAPGTVGAGQILFHDAVQPPLQAGGRYTLWAEQEVLDVRGETVPPFTAEQAFRVEGPQFRLDPAAVHMVFPPAGKEGAYFGLLPHVVFNDFALPWSRPLKPDAGPDAREPWMALLTVYDDELDAKVGKVRTVTPAEVARPAEAGVLAPCIAVPPPAPAGADPVAVADVELAFFRAIAPTRAELPFLAHGRTVNTGGKVMLGMDQDGSFSLVVGNRQVKNGGGSTALLVSLEGHQDHLAGGGPLRNCDGSAPAQPFTRIRLVVLASWSFTALKLPGTFVDLLADLAENRGGVRLLRLPGAEGAPPPPPAPGDARALGEAAAREALELGYVALRNEMRSGEVATSWFRGPLAAAPTARDHAYGPYRLSDHAVHYDPATGLFDHAYAGAWQIGRLLALSDGPFARALFDWRRGWLSSLRARTASEAVEARVADALSLDAEPRALGPGVTGHLRDFFAGRFPEMADELPRVRHRGAAAAPSPFVEDEATPPELDLAVLDDVEDDGDDPLVALRERLQRAER
jgi:hypothetical protein